MRSSHRFASYLGHLKISFFFFTPKVYIEKLVLYRLTSRRRRRRRVWVFLLSLVCHDILRFGNHARRLSLSLAGDDSFVSLSHLPFHEKQQTSSSSSSNVGESIASVVTADRFISLSLSSSLAMLPSVVFA